MENKNKTTQLAFRVLLNLAKALPVALLVVIGNTRFTPTLAAANPLIGQEQAIIEETNQIRVQAGLPALVMDNRLMTSAARKAADMANQGYFSHANPQGQRMAYWINGAGYTYALAGENIAKGYHSLNRLIDAWAASLSHLKNMVEPKFTQMGVGMATGRYEDQETTFVVQHFGAPATSIAKDISKFAAGLAPMVAPLIEAVAGVAETAQPTWTAPVQSSPLIPTAAAATPAEMKDIQPTTIEIAQAQLLPATAGEPHPIPPLKSIRWPLLVLTGLV
ncbi:MAG: CAP domain-containing protein, partial [bacterium]